MITVKDRTRTRPAASCLGPGGRRFFTTTKSTRRGFYFHVSVTCLGTTGRKYELLSSAAKQRPAVILKAMILVRSSIESQRRRFLRSPSQRHVTTAAARKRLCRRQHSRTRRCISALIVLSVENSKCGKANNPQDCNQRINLRHSLGVELQESKGYK